MCFFHSDHDKEHHILDINKKESFENNDTSYEKLMNELVENNQNVKKLKRKIEEEIEKIN